ncbi:MAG: hypothetical protein ACX93O_11920 [Flagellimonas sp.]
MKGEMLMKTEVFVFLAFIFLFFVLFYSIKLKENEEEQKRNPPIIILSEENENHRFNSGSAEIPLSLLSEIKTSIVPQLETWILEYKCDAIMVIGHTDEEAVSNRVSNLDYELTNELNGQTQNPIKPGSNVDLGMMRSLAVLKELRKFLGKSKLDSIKYWLPYSAGQLILTDDQLDLDYTNSRDKSRRRIEIILHKHEKRSYLNSESNIE